MGRSPCCEKMGLKKGPWTPEEDQKLISYIEQHGHGSWRALPSKAGLQRCGKSCRLRWTNYLRPDIKRGKFSLQEERTIIQLHALLGNRWSAIAAHLPKRTDNEIKNYWNTHLKKRLVRMGIDPTTHKPKAHGSASSSTQAAANLSHMAQWESARLEAEARLVRDSKFAASASASASSSGSARLVLNKIPAQPPRPPCLDILKAWQNSWPSTSSLSKFMHHHQHHNMYALMLADNVDVLESPTSTLAFPESVTLPPPPPPPAPAGDDTWGCLSLTKDDDIMVAVEAFMGDRYYNNNSNNDEVSKVVLSSSNSVMGLEGIVNIGMSGGEDFNDVAVYDCNHDDLAAEQSLVFMHNSNDDGDDNDGMMMRNVVDFAMYPTTDHLAHQSFAT